MMNLAKGKKVKILTSQGFEEMDAGELKRNDVFQVEPMSVSYYRGEPVDDSTCVFISLGNLNLDGQLHVLPYVRD